MWQNFSSRSPPRRSKQPESFSRFLKVNQDSVGNRVNEPLSFSPSCTGLGYLAFPPGAQTPLADLSNSNQDNTNAVSESEKERSDDPHTWADQQQAEAYKRSARMHLENTEATLGEFDWVRSGGILRDSHGRRDKVRTEAIRAEIKLQEQEKEIMKKWDDYESRWRTLIQDSGQVRFEDIPWPQDLENVYMHGTVSVNDLDLRKMVDFLLAPLTVRANTVTRKERVRASWLRWHPDKMSSLLARIVTEDVDAAKEGIGVVVACLRTLQDSS